uniref:Uncharacterized protein n=1 Tax=Romanomermis culicivorax TaxID=13658 RepID=A0A915HXA4_ROMCU
MLDADCRLELTSDRPASTKDFQVQEDSKICLHQHFCPLTLLGHELILLYYVFDTIKILKLVMLINK